MNSRIGVALLDFGGPRGPDELVPFLTELLADVLPGPGPLVRWIAPRLARARSRVVGPNYEMIGWSPLVSTHRAQAAALRERLGDPAPPLASGMLFSPPTIDGCVAELLDAGVEGVIALPMFPHYSRATTGAAFSFFHEALVQAGRVDMPVHWIGAYPEHPGYVAALAATIRAGVSATPGPEQEPVHLLFSPHGLPVSYVQGGDPYADHIRASVRAVIRALDWGGPYHVGWQSRVGPVQWLTPSTPAVLADLAKRGATRVCFVPISFAAEHIETLHEIDIEYAEEAHRLGIEHVGRAPALGTEPDFIACLADQIRGALSSFDRYSCVRCLMPKPDEHRRRKKCPNCRFEFPSWARFGRGGTTR